MDRSLTLKKLHAYVKNPTLIKEPTIEELADLVTVVLGAVSQIEQAIKEGRLDGKTPEPDKDYISADTAKRMIQAEINRMLSTADTVLSETATELEKRVQTALQNIRNGNDGIVSEAEIERAAEMAMSMIELPDFQSMLNEQLADLGYALDEIESLKASINEIASRPQIAPGGTSSNLIKKIAWVNGNSTSPNTLTVSATEPTNPKENDLWVSLA